ncbi:MAG TPA: inorganic phosphate transporter [Pseudomonadota bacterium]|jgi:PiT family inorganic phosphate transporter|nr:inorganic phosphate transporter [Pseudomonadota bacterium]
MLTLLVLVVLFALIFDYINGFHDAANAIATVVSTGVLPVRTAVLMAAALDFVGALTGTAVAKTIAKDFASPEVVSQVVVLSALSGACFWNLFTWWFGIPSSSSHALIGSLAGAVVAKGGFSAFNFVTLQRKVLVPLVTSPAAGFVIALALMIGLTWLLRGVRAATVNRNSRRAQLLSASLMAFAHGSNDAQKSMGIITLALLAFVASGDSHHLPTWMLPKVVGSQQGVPLWVIIACASAMALGTANGGQRIIKTMGSKIIRIAPIQGCVAETAGGLTILFASFLGIPVSTTHCISASIMGVGAAKRLSAVRWGVAGNIVIAWVLTVPISGAVAFGMYHMLSRLLHSS